MPQEFRVLKCFKCFIYQVDIVKKANKWQCKLCGEKQSVQKEFANGSAKDCRIRAQKLNEKHIPEEHLVFKVAQIASQERTTDITDNSKEDSSCVSSGSKWESFVDKTQDDNDENFDGSDNLFISTKFEIQSNNTKKLKAQIDSGPKQQKLLKLPQKRKFNTEETPLQVKNTFQSAKDYKDSSSTSSGNKWENFVDKTTEDDEENDDWFDKAMTQEIDNLHPVSKSFTHFDTQTGNIKNVKTPTYRSPKLSKRPKLSQTPKLTIEETSSSTTNTFQNAKDVNVLKVGLNDKPTSSSKWSKFTVDENVE